MAPEEAKLHDTLSLVSSRAREVREIANKLASPRDLSEDERRALRREAHGLRATRDEAIKLARDGGAKVGEIAAAAAMAESSVSQIINGGPFAPGRIGKGSR